MAERKKPQTDHQAPRTGARNPRLTTVLLLTGIVISIGVAVAVGYFGSQLVVWVVRVIAIILAVVFLYRLIRLGYRYEWTGFGEADLPKPENREVRPKKTVWDWLQLFIVPLALAAIGLWFAAQQDARQQDIEEKRAMSDRQIEKQRAQDAALQAYLDQMSQLMLDKDLLSSEEDGEVRTLARARTQTVLGQLDNVRKASVVQFLYDASLIKKDDPVLDLRQVVLRGANLSQLDLSSVNLTDADLTDADLSGAVLNDADLSGADLSGADLRDANMSGAILINATLEPADLSGATLNNAKLIDAKLSGANLSNALLRYANLTEAKLVQTDLGGADLSGADLSDALLNDALLNDALLNDARGITKEQLEDQAKTLKGAIMPGGSIYH